MKKEQIHTRQTDFVEYKVDTYQSLYSRKYERDIVVI